MKNDLSSPNSCTQHPISRWAVQEVDGQKIWTENSGSPTHTSQGPGSLQPAAVPSHPHVASFFPLLLPQPQELQKTGQSKQWLLRHPPILVKDRSGYCPIDAKGMWRSPPMKTKDTAGSLSLGCVCRERAAVSRRQRGPGDSGREFWTRFCPDWLADPRGAVASLRGLNVLIC